MADKLAELEKRIERLEKAVADKLWALEKTESIQRKFPDSVPTKKNQGK